MGPILACVAPRRPCLPGPRSEMPLPCAFLILVAQGTAAPDFPARGCQIFRLRVFSETYQFKESEYSDLRSAGQLGSLRGSRRPRPERPHRFGPGPDCPSPNSRPVPNAPRLASVAVCARSGAHAYFPWGRFPPYHVSGRRLLPARLYPYGKLAGCRKDRYSRQAPHLSGRCGDSARDLCTCQPGVSRFRSVWIRRCGGAHTGCAVDIVRAASRNPAAEGP